MNVLTETFHKRIIRTAGLFFLLCAGVGGSGMAAGETIARLPPMGWSSWNAFAKKIDEQLIKDTADAMIQSGLADAGYEYVCIDDGWYWNRRNDE